MRREEACCSVFFSFFFLNTMFVLTTQYLSQSEPNLTCTTVRLGNPGMSVRTIFHLYDSEKNWSKLISLVSSHSSDATQNSTFSVCICVCGRRGGGKVRGGFGSWRQSVYLWVFCRVSLLRCKGLYCECRHFRSCTCFYIWFVSVCECDCVAQLHHVGVYIFIF